MSNRETALALAIQAGDAVRSAFAPYLAKDTAFPGEPECYVAAESPMSAIVVYIDEPGASVATGNAAGRFVRVDGMRAALEAAEHWLAEEAASPHPGQTRPDDILRTIRDALGKPPDATDAAPSAPQTPPPVVGPHHGPELSEQLRLARALIGTDDTQGRHEARACIDRSAHVSALMLAALRGMSEAFDNAHFGAPHERIARLYEECAKVRAAIRAAEGREG